MEFYIRYKSIQSHQYLKRTTTNPAVSKQVNFPIHTISSPMIQKPSAASYCWVSPPVVCHPLSLLAAHSSTLNHGCTPTCRHWCSVSYHHHGHHNCDQLLPVLCIVIPRRHQICTTEIHNIHVWLYIINSETLASNKNCWKYTENFDWKDIKILDATHISMTFFLSSSFRASVYIYKCPTWCKLCSLIHFTAKSLYMFLVSQHQSWAL